MPTIDLFFTITDDKAEKSTVVIPIPDTTAFADVVEFVGDMGELLDSLISGYISGAGFTVSVDLTGVSTVATLLSDVQEKARFAFIGVNDFIKSLSIPTFLESKFGLHNDVVDLADPDVAAFVTAMEDGLTMTSTNVVEPTDIRGDDLLAVTKAQAAWGRARS